MIDLTFGHAIYWFFMNNNIVLINIGFITAITTIITFFTLIQRWGEGY